MNQIVPIVADPAATVRQSEVAALLSLVTTLRRLSWDYRYWALEDQARGDLDAYRKHAAEARRLWRSALAHLTIARNKSYGT